MPLTRSYLVTSNKELSNLPIQQKSTKFLTVLGPVYVLEESQDYLHVAKEGGGEWYRNWVTTYAIQKDKVAYLRNERIEQGGPRGGHLHGS